MSDLEAAINGEVQTEEPANPVLTEQVAEDLKASAEPAGEEDSTPPVEAEDKQESQPAESVEDKAFKAKALDETKKRQALQAELNQTKQQLSEARQPTDKPDFWADPDGAIGNLSVDVDNRISQAVTNMSVAMMKSMHSDYDEKESVFIDMVSQNPALATQMNQSINPAEFAYNTAKSHIELQEIGDIDSYKAKIRAELKLEMEGEKNAEIKKAIETRSELPGSLSSERAAGGNKSLPYTPTALDSIIG